MGWRELMQWLRECNRAREAEAGKGTTDPDSWAGYESDGWWAEQREEQRRLRGR